MTQRIMIAALTLTLSCCVASRSGRTLSAPVTDRPKPRGDARIVYVSDAASDTRSILTQNPTADQLRGYINMLADNGVDIFAHDIFQKQGVTWFEPEHPDHAHLKTPVDGIPAEDGPPITIAIEQVHKRGMKFLAAFRMADRHGGQGAGLIKRRPDLWNPEFGDIAAMDWTHDDLRDWMFALVDEILRRFDVDGFEFTYTRWMHCFPTKTARLSHPIMTQFLRRVRSRLDEVSKQKGRRLMLGVRVPQTLEECDALGYDVATWAREGLVDYLAPCDFFFTDFNTTYEDFAAITRGTDCMLYPAVHPPISTLNAQGIMTPANYRAASRNMYAAGADGISQFNYQYNWGRRRSNYPYAPAGYPQALAWLRHLRNDGRYDELPRHYLFYPLWGNGASQSGFMKNDRIVLKREVGSSGEYRFRIAEDLTTPGLAAELIVVAVSADNDRLAFSLNGTPLPAGPIKAKRQGKGRPDNYGRKLPPYWAYMIPLSAPPAVFGDNILRAEVTELDARGEGDILVEELEVTIVPRWEGSR